VAYGRVNARRRLTCWRVAVQPAPLISFEPVRGAPWPGRVLLQSRRQRRQQRLLLICCALFGDVTINNDVTGRIETFPFPRLHTECLTRYSDQHHHHMLRIIEHCIQKVNKLAKFFYRVRPT